MSFQFSFVKASLALGNQKQMFLAILESRDSLRIFMENTYTIINENNFFFRSFYLFFTLNVNNNLSQSICLNLCKGALSYRYIFVNI